MVLDLRFADGDDYAAAAAVADLFLADANPLLDWGNGVVKSEKKDDIINLPVAVLVNRETGGAAEALAAVLRETGVGLILGGTTAGRAMISQEFALKSGQRLRIATSPVKLGDGTALAAQGVKPDIEVAVNAERGARVFRGCLRAPAKTNLPGDRGLSATNQLDGTNRPCAPSAPHGSRSGARPARRHKPGPKSTFVRDAEPEKPLIRDPALARAVDLLKGPGRGAAIAALISSPASDIIGLTIYISRPKLAVVVVWFRLNEDHSFCLHGQRLPQPDGGGAVPPRPRGPRTITA